MTIDAFVTLLEVELGMRYTEEQRNFIQSLTSPGICFASPGTGKTASAIAGLLTTEMFHKIPGDGIYALSFTNMATLEMSVRHKKACEKLGIKQRVNFKTLHAMCSEVIRTYCNHLGMYKLEVKGTIPLTQTIKLVEISAKSYNIRMDAWKARRVVQAARALNSSLTFARDSVESKAVFKDTKLSYDEFMAIRLDLYESSKNVEQVQVNDILLYTLELMLRAPEVSAEMKKKCKVLLIDEAQDMSLLQLRLATLMSDNVIVIGDIKQQIYAFNGACQEIVQQYYKYFPNAWTIHFTKSFRCRNEIANFATGLILPNKVGGEDFEGVGEGGIVTIENGSDYNSVCKRIADEYFSNGRKLEKGVLFLFRNNYSASPIVEEFYKLKMPFRVKDYKSLLDMPIIKDLIAIVNMLEAPNDVDAAKALLMLIPEFRQVDNYKEHAFFKYMKKERCSIFDVPYNFNDQYNSEMAFGMLVEVSDMIKRNAKVSDIFNRIYKAYYNYWLMQREMYLEQEPKYYFRLAGYAMRGKTYREFVKDEVEKMRLADEYNMQGVGVRCYTFHSAKGLEDDIVYMIDCDEDIIPNKNSLTRLINGDSIVDAARDVRNERSLVYVAATRAKEELHIFYNDTLSSLLTTDNEYEMLDDAYMRFNQNYLDVEVFEEFFNGEILYRKIAK